MRRLVDLCFGSLVILDVARCCLWLFTLYINIKIGKNSCSMLDWPVAACLGGCCSPGCRL